MQKNRQNLKKIDQHFLETSKLIQESLSVLREPIIEASKAISQSLHSGNKILICGNGGSAADAQHFTAELLGFYLKERQPLPAIALTTNTSSLTAISNDYSFVEVFSRQLHAFAKPGDILFCISTSGNSNNVLAAAILARTLKLKTIGLLGNMGGKIGPLCDISLIVPSKYTPYVQEVQLITMHTICDLVESTFCD